MSQFQAVFGLEFTEAELNYRRPGNTLERALRYTSKLKTHYRTLCFLALIAASFPPRAAAQTSSATLPLMPWPSEVTRQSGSLAISKSFSISVSGSGAGDPRVQYEVQRTFERISRQTGIPILPNVVQNSSGPTLAIVVERKDHKSPQRLGDDERYSLEISNGRARLSADAPLGVIFGLNTFLQLVQQNTTETAATPASPGFSVPAVTIRDEPRFPWRGLSLDVSRHFIPDPGS